MIVLDTSTRSLQVVLAGAKNTNDAPFLASYYDENLTPNFAAPTASSNPGTTNGVTAATIMPAQGLAPGWRRRLKSFNLNNADLAAITVSIQYVDTAASTTVLYKITLQTLEQLTYEDGYGFVAYDSGGAVKSQAAATSSATSQALSVASASSSVLLVVSSLQSGASVQSFTSTTFSTVSSAASLGLIVSSLQSGASAQSFTSTTFSTISSAASLGLLVSSLQSAASVQSFTSTTFSTISTNISGQSAQSFTSTNYSTISSATSRVKSSFGW